MADTARLTNHRHLLDSIRAQEERLDDLWVSMYVGPDIKIELNTLYNGKHFTQEPKHPTIVNYKRLQDAEARVRRYPSYFLQLQHLLGRAELQGNEVREKKESKMPKKVFNTAKHAHNTACGRIMRVFCVIVASLYHG